MIHRNIAKSDKLLTLAKQGHTRACWFYAAHIPYLDKSGRMKANPYGLKGTLWEAWPYTVQDIADDLDALAGIGLITLYKTKRGELVMQYAKFDEEHGGFNKPHPNEPESEYDAPNATGSASSTANNVLGNVVDNVPDNVAHNVPPQRSRQRSDKVASEYELEKEKEIEKEVSQERTSTSLTRATDHTPFLEAWNQHRRALPAVRTLDNKRKRALDQLTKEHGDQALPLFTAAVQHVASDDFWIERGYGLDNLLRPGRVLEKAEKQAANNGMTPGDRRLATTADIIARAIGGIDA